MKRIIAAACQPAMAAEDFAEAAHDEQPIEAVV